MDTLTTVRRMHQHRDWANRRLRDLGRNLTPAQLDQTFEIGLGTVRKTLTHLHAAESAWLIVLHGEPNTPSSFGFHYDSFAELESAWDESERGWSELLAGLTAEDLSRPITKVVQATGVSFSVPMHDILLHVCMHAHYHSAQAVNMMRHLGIAADKLPNVMVVSMSREEQAGKA